MCLPPGRFLTWRRIEKRICAQGQKAGFCVTATTKYHELCFDCGMSIATVSFDHILAQKADVQYRKSYLVR